MFSQYSWWDFIKVVGTALVIYYGYVLWTYYREDIREWLSNLGHKPQERPPVPTVEEEADEADESEFYSVKTYSAPTQSSLVETVSAELPDAPLLRDSGISSFDLAVEGQVSHPQEFSISELQQTAKGLVVDQYGTVSATNSNDAEGKRLANVLNGQKAASLVEGIPFNR